MLRLNAQRVARRIAAAELPIVLAIAPALLFPTPARLALLAIMPIVWCCARASGDHCVPRTPINAGQWVILAMVGISLWATFDVLASLTKISGVVLGALVFWAVSRWLTTSVRLHFGGAVFILAGALLAVIGLLGTDWFDKFPALSPVVVRLPKLIRGLPGAETGFQPNAVAGGLLLFVPLQVALLAAGAHRWVWPRSPRRLSGAWFVGLEMVCLILTIGTLLLTQSRGAWVGLLVATAAFLLWHNRGTRVLAAAAAGALVLLTVTVGPGPLAEFAISRSGFGMASNVPGRLDVWSRALLGIQDFPITGMGMNSFRKLMPVLYPAILVPLDYDIAHAHNHLLQAALDLGVPGLIAYGSIWLVASALLVAVYRRTSERLYRVMAAGLGAGLIAHFTFGLTDAIPLGSKVGVLFWLTLALVVGLHRIALPGFTRSR